MFDGSAVVLIDLYILRINGVSHHFAACDTNIKFYDPETGYEETYIAQPIQRGKVRSTVDSKLDNVELKISDVGEEFASAIFNGTDFRGQRCEIIQIAYPASLGRRDEFRYIFVGDIDAPTLDEGDKIFTCQVISKLPNTEGGRLLMLQCNAEFGNHKECGAIKDKDTGTISLQDNKSTFYMADRKEKTDYWTDGLLFINGEIRRISKYELDSKKKYGKVVLEYPLWDYPSGNYSIEQGCDKSHKTCINRFDNGENYGGFPSVPFELQITG